MLIGAATFTVIKFSHPAKNDGADVATQKTTVGEKKNAITIPSTKKQADNDNNEVVSKESADNIAQVSTDKKEQPVAPKTNTADHEKKEGLAKNNDQLIQNQRILPTPSPVQPNKDVALTAGNQKFEKINPEESNISMAINVPKKVIIDQNIMETQKNSFASNASLTEETNDNRILYLNEDDVSRSKAGGFLRKLKRTVERKTKIKGGNGLKIAGFEIALN